MEPKQTISTFLLSALVGSLAEFLFPVDPSLGSQEILIKTYVAVWLPSFLLKYPSPKSHFQNTSLIYLGSVTGQSISRIIRRYMI